MMALSSSCEQEENDCYESMSKNIEIKVSARNWSNLEYNDSHYNFYLLSTEVRAAFLAKTFYFSTRLQQSIHKSLSTCSRPLPDVGINFHSPFEELSKWKSRRLLQLYLSARCYHRRKFSSDYFEEVRKVRDIMEWFFGCGVDGGEGSSSTTFAGVSQLVITHCACRSQIERCRKAEFFDFFLSIIFDSWQLK